MTTQFDQARAHSTAPASTRRPLSEPPQLLQESVERLGEIVHTWSTEGDLDATAVRLAAKRMNELADQLEAQ